MLRMVAGRTLRLGLVLVLVTLSTSLFLDLVPGDPALAVLGGDPTPEAIAAVNQRYGFDDSFLVRYWHWVLGVLHGDLGESFQTGQAVTQALAQRLPVTIQLAVMATALALVIAIPLALVTAYRAGSLVDRAVDTATSVFIAVPAFLSGLLLVYLLSIRWGVLPVTGWVPFTEDPAENLRHAVLPVVVLALPAMAVFQRVLRADVIATLQSDHIALARAKGISTARILGRHALRVSSYSLLTVVGLRLAQLVGGTVVVEVIFAVPGIGSLLVDSILGSDLIMVQGLVVVIAAAYLVVNFAIDIAYQLLDPRVSA